MYYRICFRCTEATTQNARDQHVTPPWDRPRRTPSSWTVSGTTLNRRNLRGSFINYVTHFFFGGGRGFALPFQKVVHWGLKNWTHLKSEYSGDPKNGNIRKPDVLTSSCWMVDHSKTGPFVNWSTSDHLKTGHVRFLDPYCILNCSFLYWSGYNPDHFKNPTSI